MIVSELRQNIYQLLDQVLDTGVPLEIERKGRKLRITAGPPRDKLANLKRRDCLVGDPEDFVNIRCAGRLPLEVGEIVGSASRAGLAALSRLVDTRQLQDAEALEQRSNHMQVFGCIDK